jgi:acyl carrier protein
MAVDTSVHSRLEAIFKDVFEQPELEITRETSAETVPEWDSLSLIMLVSAIEAEFGLRFSGQELEEFESVGRLEDFLAGRPA